MKRNSLRPKSLPEFSKSSSRLSIQRPKSLPGISKRPFSTPKPIKPLLIYSPAESKESTSSPLNSSAMRSPPPAAKIDVIHPIDLSQYDALLPQTHAYPLKIVAIYYIYLVYTIINSFSYNIENILQKINDTDYMQPELFKKEAIERLIALRENILKEQYKYKALDGSIIDIEDKCALIEMLITKITIKTERNVYRYLRFYLRVLKYDNEKIENIVLERYNEMYPIRTDDQLQRYIDKKIFTQKIRSEIIRWFDNINIAMVNNKFESQYKLIEELINILNDIWIDEKTKGGFIKYILKTQKTTGIQSGGMLKFVSSKFMRSNRVLQEPEYQPTMNTHAKTGISNRVLPEQVLHLNMYRRVHTVNFQNILDYISLIKSYLFEEDEEIIRIRYEKKLEKEIIRYEKKLEKERIRYEKEIIRYNKLLKRDYEKEYRHLNKKIIARLNEPIHKEKSEWILDEEFKNFDYKEAKILIPLKLKEFEKVKFKKPRFKKVVFKHVKFDIKCSIKYIKTRIDQVENDLSELLPIRINSLA